MGNLLKCTHGKNYKVHLRKKKKITKNAALFTVHVFLFFVLFFVCFVTKLAWLPTNMICNIDKLTYIVKKWKPMD